MCSYFSRNYIQSHSKTNKSKVELILESQKSTQGKGTDSLVPSTPSLARSLMGNLTEEASQVAAAFRIILGALGMTFGIVSISCRNFPVVEAQT